MNEKYMTYMKTHSMNQVSFFTFCSATKCNMDLKIKIANNSQKKGKSKLGLKKRCVNVFSLYQDFPICPHDTPTKVQNINVQLLNTKWNTKK